MAKLAQRLKRIPMSRKEFEKGCLTHNGKEQRRWARRWSACNR